MPVLAKVLRDLRWSSLGFGLSGALMAVAVVAIFPRISAELGDIEYPEEIGQAFGLGVTDLSDPAQFFSVEFFSWIPILFLAYIYRAASTHLAGEEADGTLDLILAQPIRRSRFILETFGALAVGAVVVSGLSALGFAAAWYAVDIEGLGLASVVGACFLMVPFLIAVAALTLLAGSVSPRRTWTTGGVLGFLVVGYLVFVLSGFDENLRWLQYLTPFYYAGLTTALTDGVSAWRVVVLVASSGTMLGATLWAFSRRELSSGQSPLAGLWQGHSEEEATMATSDSQGGAGGSRR
jgi:ABC-2 type transport system permease protein